MRDINFVIIVIVDKDKGSYSKMFRNLISKYIAKFKNLGTDKISKKIVIIFIGLIIMSLFSSYFISANEELYNKPIAKNNFNN